MCQSLSYFAVVGEHEDTGGVLVETSYREYSCAAVFQQIHHCLLCVRVACSRNESLRLVHHDVYFLFTADSFAVESDVVVEDIDLGTEFCDYFAVYGHDTCLDVLVCLAA